MTGFDVKSKNGTPLHYKGTKFHSIIDGKLAIGGDTTKDNGTGGESIYGPSFEREGFPQKHSKPYTLSMAVNR